jgi:hypothetical protein
MADQTRCVRDGSFSACASVRHHIGHLLLAVAVVAGCSTGAGPVGHPVDISPETTSTPPPPVPVAALDGLLPAPDQLNDMFHTVTLHVIDNDFHDVFRRRHRTGMCRYLAQRLAASL